jgi:hypothetical protein
MSNITIEQLESAFIKADDAGNTEDALAFANAIREYRAEASKPPEGVKEYEDVVPEDVKQKEQERLEAPPVSVNPMAAGGGALTKNLVQSSTDFLRYMGFGEFGEKKSVEGVGETTRAKELGYQFKKAGNNAARLLTTAEAYSPSRVKMMRNPETGRLEQVSAEVYYDDALKNQGITGEQFLNMTPEKREDILLKNKELMAREAYQITADVLDIAGEDETMKATGTILSEIADPLLIPAVVASSVGTVPMLLAGGVYGLASEGSRQMVQDDLNADELAKSFAYGTLFSAAFAPVQTAGLAYKTAVRAPLKTVEKGGKRVLNLVNNTKATKGSQATADKIADKLQERTAYHLFNTKQSNGKGVTNKQAVALAEKDLSLNAKNKIDVLKYASKDKRPSYLSKENASKIMANLDNPAASTTKIGKAWDYIGAPLSQVLRNVDQRLAGAVRNHDMRTSVALANTLREAEGFNSLMGQAGKIKDSALKAKYYEMELALNNGQILKASNIAKKHFGDLKFKKSKSANETGLADEMRTLNKLLDDVHTRANKAGIKMSYLTNYMPRYVKDLDGLRQAVGKKTNSVIDEALATEAKKRGLGHWSELDDEIAADIITKSITRKTPPSGKKRLESARTIRTIPQHLQKYYHDTPTALQLYINKAEREIAKHEFFGKSVAYNKAGKIELDESINNTIGKHVLDMKKRGKDLTNAQQDDLRLLLKARFEAADKAMGKTMASVRDLQYAALLGQFDSALIQLGDIGSSLYLNGVMNTAKALATGNKRAKITADDLGLVNQVSAELQNLNGMTKFLDFALTYSGFRRIDRLGKDTFIKASWRKNTKLARANPDAIAKKYGDVFENETADLIADLQAGRVTDNTKLLMWNELADVQPIALSEMPQAYLEMANGRILYSLKSFGLKQLNLIRQNIVKRGQRGDVTGAFEEALKYSLLVGMANGSIENARNFLRSGFDPDALRDIDDVTYESLSKILFLSKYSREKYLAKGQYGTFVTELLTPAAPSILDAMGEAMNNVLFEQENDYEAFNKALQKVPIAGRSYYYLLGGGAEKVIEQVEKEEREEK